MPTGTISKARQIIKPISKWLDKPASDTDLMIAVFIIIGFVVFMEYIVK